MSALGRKQTQADRPLTATSSYVCFGMRSTLRRHQRSLPICTGSRTGHDIRDAAFAAAGKSRKWQYVPYV